MINFYSNDLDDDTKILTHWLCYIADRQMSYKLVWAVGGFVISELIYSIKESKELELLNPDNHISFIKKEKTKDRYFLISQSEPNDLIINDYEQYIHDNKVKFKSRFFPSDYFSILFTLTFLE